MNQRGTGRHRILRISAHILAALYVCTLVLFLFLPFPQLAGRARDDTYSVEWADGMKTEETFAKLYPDLVGLKDDKVLFMRDGIEGTAAVAGLEETERVLQDGTLLELQSLDMGALDRLSRVAIVRAYSRAAWQTNGETFAITATGFKPLKVAQADLVVLISGAVTAGKLKSFGAKELWLRGEAKFTYSSLLDTEIETVRAQAPYSENGGALYLDTPSGYRLLAAVPAAKELTVTGNSYADLGSLLPCKKLERLTLDFVGNTASPIGSEFDGYLGYLFSDGEDYFVPETLTYLQVTGGVLVPNAFYYCYSLKEIDACGMEADGISREAFARLSLETLHTPNPDVQLNGEYTSEYLPCGCTLFRKSR